MSDWIGNILLVCVSNNTVSFGVEMANWPWSPDYVNLRTYVVVDFDITVHLLGTDASLGYARTQDGGLLTLNTSESFISVRADRGYVVDGTPYLPKLVGGRDFQNFPLFGPMNDKTALRQQMCTEINYGAKNDWTPWHKWTNASYDPTFTAYFFGNAPGSKVLTPQEKKDKKTTGIVAGVIVGLVVVGLASAGVIIFAYRNYQHREATRLTFSKGG